MPASRTVTDLDWEGTPVRLVRSTARTRTVQAVWREGRLQISVPARLGRAEQRRWIARMVARAGAPATGAPPGSTPAPPAPVPAGAVPAGADRGGDPELTAWAARLSAAHLDGRAVPTSVTWSTRQRHRWGSCTPARGTIRLSTQLRGMPEWVVAAVLVHELAHLLEPGHGPAFQALVARCPRYAEAMAFLDGVTFARHRGLAAGGEYPGADEGAEDDDGAPAA